MQWWGFWKGAVQRAPPHQLRGLGKSCHYPHPLQKISSDLHESCGHACQQEGTHSLCPPPPLRGYAAVQNNYVTNTLATTQVKLLTLAHCTLYTSYATSCTSSACITVRHPSHYPIRFQFRPGISTPLVPTGFQNFKSTTLLKADSQIHRCTKPYVTTRPKSQASWAKTLSNWTPCFVALEIGIIILILMLLLLLLLLLLFIITVLPDLLVSSGRKHPSLFPSPQCTSVGYVYRLMVRLRLVYS